jgi:methylthioxylose transferase
MASTQPATRRTSAAGWGLVTALGLMVLAMAVPALTGWFVHVNSFPPLHAEWAPRVGWGTAPALLLAVLGVRHGIDIAEALPWRRLLLVVFLAGLGWMLALAFVDGSHGVSQVLGEPYEYLRTARRTSDLHATLQEYVSRIRIEAGPRHWPVHVAGHPPGALTFFVALDRVGLGSGFAAGMVVTALAATTAVAVLVTARVLGAEPLARRAAPFLVLGPAAVWQSVSADAMFAATAAWAIACLALAATRRSLGWSVLAGLLLGCCVMMSYGLPLLGLLAVAVLLAARSWFPLVPAAVASVAVVLGFAAFGFGYLEALPAIRDRYFEAVGGRRPWAYWMWGDLAALAFSAGPLAFAGAAQLPRARLADARTRTVAWLSGAAAAMVLLADLSQMSRAEVERIWLPFVPWLLLSCGLLSEEWRRRGLTVQVVLALAVQHLLLTGW